MRKRLTALLVAAGLFGFVGADARATTIYAVAPTVANGPTDNIYAIDTATGIVSLVGGSTLTDGFNISAGPAAGMLYVSTGDASGTPGPLYAFDLSNNIYALGVGSVPPGALGEGRDGSLYAGDGFGALWQVNPTTGVSTSKGTGANQYDGDLATDPLTNTLYGVVFDGNGDDSLVTVDKTNGTQTPVGGLMGPGFLAGTGVWGLAFGLDGSLWAAGPDLNSASGAGIFYSVDKSNGVAAVATNVTLNFAPWDLASEPAPAGPGPVAAVPEPGSLGLIAIAFGAAALTRRRRPGAVTADPRGTR